METNGLCLQERLALELAAHFNQDCRSMTGHRMDLTRRPSSFLLIPVGQEPTGICILLWMRRLLAQRADIGRDIGGLGPVQRKIGHLWMRVEQEVRYLFR
jgi:hypothetical protein